MRVTLLIAAVLLAGTGIANAASDAQRMIGGGLFPIFVNGVGTTQIMTPQTYVNQTQYTPSSPSTGGSRALLLGAGR